MGSVGCMWMKSSFLDSAVNSAWIVILTTMPQKATDQRDKLEKMSKWIRGDWVKQGERGLRVKESQEANASFAVQQQGT